MGEFKFSELMNTKLELAREMGWDMAKIKEVWNWVTDSKTGEVPMCAISKDGIYLVLPDLTCVHYDTASHKDKADCIAVGVKMGDKFANVVLHDANDGEDVSLTVDSCDTGRYKRNFIAAISDWDGKGNTEALREYLNPDIDLKDNEYIPAVGEQHLILLNIQEVNRVLEEVGGSAIKPNWYWSSTENNSNSAWYVYFNNGYTNSYLKNNSCTVRPSVACEFSL